MNSSERRLLDQLKSYALLVSDIEQLRKDIEMLSYRVTANYGLTGGGSSSFEGSKVETFGMRRIELERKLSAKETVLAQIDSAIEYAGLSKRERDLVECTMSGHTLSSYARRKNIYKSHVYKLRDSALRKMVTYIEENSKRNNNRVKS